LDPSQKKEKYIEAFEMWCYRRLLRIPWRDATRDDEGVDFE